MATLSTLSTFNPPKTTQLQNSPKPADTVKNIWSKFFAGKHNEVLNESMQALFASAAPDLLHVCAMSMIESKRVEDGIALMKAAVALYPQSANWFVNGSVATLNAGAFDRALEFATAGLARFKDEPTLHFAHGNALMHLQRLEEAGASFSKAIQLKSDFYDAYLNLGNIFRRLNRQEEALRIYTVVQNAQPQNLMALINRAGVLLELNKHDEAAMTLLRVMATNEVPEANFMMGMIRLAEGDFKNGFDLYRSRFDCAMAANDKKEFLKPLASSLEQLAGKHVLVTHEQGYGDSIQFVRYVPELAKVAKVTILVQKTLHRLFNKLDTDVQFNMVETRQEAGNYDFECPMIHMPYLFGTTLDTIPRSTPYFNVSAGERKLPHRHPHTRQRVGLVWAGQLRANNSDLTAVDRRRSMTYADFESFMDIDTVDFVSLQLGDPATQIQSMGTKGKRVPHEVLNPFMDFLDTAEYIKQLDLVITVDTAVAHLAASIGTPVWVLSRFDQCWRWLKDREDSPWYSTLKLFHQEKPGDWTSVIEKVKFELINWV